MMTAGDFAVEGRAVLVLGAGRSGAAAAHALLDAGADVRVVDAGNTERVQQAAGALDARGALVRLDTPLDRAGLVDGVDLVVTSPGVPPATGVLIAAGERDVPVWSEVELAWRLSKGRTRIVGVTGTNGKTTTTELVAAALAAPTAGNIGTPLVSLLAGTAPPPLAVVELSSFQLHHTSTLRTDVGVLLNVAGDHLDWHGDVQAYGRDKARIWAEQRTGGSQALGGRDWAVVGVDDRGAREVMASHPPPAGVIGYTARVPRSGEVGVDAGWIVVNLDVEPVRVVRVEDLGVTGPHNVANVCAAVAAAVAAGAEPGALAEPLSTYTPGVHRLTLVDERGGVRFVDDSKATNPHAAAAAISSYPSVVWIAGGLAKGLDLDGPDMDPLIPLVRERVRAVVTIGTDGPAIGARMRRLGVEATDAGELSRAVTVAAGIARPGDTVLLAPACASMDQFTDYAERGEVFAALVADLPEGTATSAGRPERTDAHGGA